MATRAKPRGIRIALITGASTGVGRACAERLLDEGYFVILTARKESLFRLSSSPFLRRHTNYWIRPLDVRKSADRVTLMTEIEKDLGCLDILINNAGVVYRAPVELATEFEMQDQMSVNFSGPVFLIQAALPLLRKSARAQIVNISSASAFIAVPSMGLYAASKRALEGASEALWHELSPWNIPVTLVEPGFLDSKAYRGSRNSIGLARSHNAEVEEIYRQETLTVSGLIKRASELSETGPVEIANTVLKILENKAPPLRVTATLDAKALVFLRRALPGSQFEKFIRLCLNVLSGFKNHRRQLKLDRASTL
ncbi:MAG: SDR family NAD(P)-dependent oxidoreductase [Bdellovibrionales bacterium]